MSEQHLQILRHIDKLDRVGLEGVFDRLTKGARDESGAFVTGVGLDPAKSALLLAFIVEDRPIMDRLQLMELLDELEMPDGSTAWDALLAIPANDDNTWSEGRRPANIGWVLDDILAVLRRRQ